MKSILKLFIVLSLLAVPTVVSATECQVSPRIMDKVESSIHSRYFSTVCSVIADETNATVLLHNLKVAFSAQTRGAIPLDISNLIAQATALTAVDECLGINAKVQIFWQFIDEKTDLPDSVLQKLTFDIAVSGMNCPQVFAYQLALTAVENMVFGTMPLRQAIAKIGMKKYMWIIAMFQGEAKHQNTNAIRFLSLAGMVLETEKTAIATQRLTVAAQSGSLSAVLDLGALALLGEVTAQDAFKEGFPMDTQASVLLDVCFAVLDRGQCPDTLAAEAVDWQKVLAENSNLDFVSLRKRMGYISDY